VLEHAALADDVADALGPYDCDTASVPFPDSLSPCVRGLTFVLADVLERKGEAGVLALDDAHLAKGALADDAQQAEVVEVHCGAR
jgi:hypothetical protein